MWPVIRALEQVRNIVLQPPQLCSVKYLKDSSCSRYGLSVLTTTGYPQHSSNIHLRINYDTNIMQYQEIALASWLAKNAYPASGILGYLILYHSSHWSQHIILALSSMNTSYDKLMNLVGVLIWFPVTPVSWFSFFSFWLFFKTFFHFSSFHCPLFAYCICLLWS